MTSNPKHSRRFSRVSGVVLIGGGQSTLIAGIVALTQNIPLAAFPAFGGKAQEVWQKLRDGAGLATEEEACAMAASDPEAAVEAAVHSLEEQRKERERRQRARPEHRTKIGSGVLLLAWPSLLGLGAIIRPPQPNLATEVPGLNSAGESPNSARATGVPQSVPAAPSNMTASPDHNPTLQLGSAVDLAWQNNAGTCSEGDVIERSTDGVNFQTLAT